MYSKRLEKPFSFSKFSSTSGVGDKTDPPDSNAKTKEEDTESKE